MKVRIKEWKPDKKSKEFLKDVYAYHPSKNTWLGFLGTTKQFNEWRKKMIAWIDKNEK